MDEQDSQAPGRWRFDMWSLPEHFRKLNQRYHGADGDRFAAEELSPVARRFLTEGDRVLEVGCGYGRNLVALAGLPARSVVGCDVSADELRAARERTATLPDAARHRLSLVRQEHYRLPFKDGTFDLVILWQVLEHVFGEAEKRRVLAECVRVLRGGACLLIETPNQWFPVDYHDNKFPFAHWFFPRALRMEITARVRGQRYEPSQYMSLPGYERLLRTIPGVRAVRRATRFYFARSFSEAWHSVGGTQVALKRVIFLAVLPFHGMLSLFGSSGDVLLPSVRMVWRIDKHPDEPKGL